MYCQHAVLCEDGDSGFDVADGYIGFSDGNFKYLRAIRRSHAHIGI
jgi:hypothetical protein